jgi:hypothetical protein
MPLQVRSKGFAHTSLQQVGAGAQMQCLKSQSESPLSGSPLSVEIAMM